MTLSRTEYPAKMARGLVRRIFDHAFAEGWLKEGMTCVDPFGGVATTAIEGAYRNVRVVCCELEPRFVALAEKNFKLHRRKWEVLGAPQPRIVCGDSRQLARVLAEADVCVSSPPYAAMDPNTKEEQRPVGTWKLRNSGDRPGKLPSQDYGSSPGQLAAMRPGDIDCVLSSPPYAESLKGDGTQKETAAESHAKRSDPKQGGSLGQSQRTQGYGSDGNLGNLKPGEVADAILGSPPYADSPITGEGNFQSEKCPDAQPASDVRAGGYDAVVSSPPWEKTTNMQGGEHLLAKVAKTYDNQPSRESWFTAGDYGTTPGQLGSMKPGEPPSVDGIVSSPPWEQSADAQRTCNEDGTRARQATSERGSYQPKYGTANGNIGADTGDTFWSAAREILIQCFAILRVGGVAIWVTKNFVRSKKIVPFTDDWIRLCESVGFKLVCRHRAMLVKETTEQTLFGPETTKKERKSFFRRLAEKKGSPAIDWEDATCFVKSK